MSEFVLNKFLLSLVVPENPNLGVRPEEIEFASYR